ncbi:MAG: ribosome biogenesis factor YjgA, partial [Xanthomonadales bacterium]|nr:ribosome biogenesis factor YjgA [Xanthomonadales bacterium]
MKESKEFPEFEELPVSKSQRRRDALEVKALAAQLIGLSPALRAQLPLDEDVRRAIEQARAIRSNVARKRQLQFVAKLLRRADPEAIREALADFDADARKLAARQHRCEAWRDRLVDQGDAALGALLQQRPGSDGPRLRQLMRTARQEAAGGKPPAAARALFRVLREMDELEPLPP